METNKKFIRNLSLRKTLILFISASIIIAITLIGIVSSFCEQAKQGISSNFRVSVVGVYTSEEKTIFGIDSTKSLEEDAMRRISLLETIEVSSSFLLAAIFIVSAVFLFYRYKLKKPLEILELAHDKISCNDLDFIVDYASKDEMGNLCASFEKMRASLEKNNKAMWRAMTERKRLNAAFAHDLRTPLTVLKGYTEILQNGGGNNIEMLPAMAKHIERLERYAESMSNLQKIEDIMPNYRKAGLSEFFTSLEQSARILCDNAGKSLFFQNNVRVSLAMIDTEMISQVIENIVANGVRYAQSKVKIDIFEVSGVISISVIDDGTGFSAEALQKAMEPFYTEDANREEHFGLGLYMCVLLCRNHGGDITLKNLESGAQAMSSI